mgnify:CR=1 FL=1
MPDKISIFAPVIIPTLCRYEHFKRCIESLSECVGAEHTEVYVGLDYPIKDSHREGYQTICEYLAHAKFRFKKLHVLKREKNLGPGGNSSKLREEVTRDFDRWIYSEDDNVFSPNFLVYINKGLEHYKDDPRVFAICGYTMPVDWKIGDNNHFATRSFRAWGYGVWLNKYTDFWKSRNGKWISDFLYKKKNANKESFFQLYRNEYGIWESAIKHLFMRKIYYGDMMVYAYLLGTNRYIICPSRSLVRNEGFDKFGVNYKEPPKWLKEIDFDSSNESFDLNGDPFLFVQENERRRRLFGKKINKVTIHNLRGRISFFFKIFLRVLFRGKENRTW